MARSDAFVAILSKTQNLPGFQTISSSRVPLSFPGTSHAEWVSCVRDRWVHFKISDVYFPDAAKILGELHGEDLLQGKVLDVSDSGGEEGAFVVVEVEGLTEPVVVAVGRIKGLL